MDEAQLKEWILRELGAPLVKVEQTKEQLNDKIENAKRWFSAKKGVLRFSLLRVIDGLTEYCLEDDVDTVIDVTFSVSALDISLIFSPFILIDDRVPYDVFAAPSSAGLYSSFAQTLQYIQQAKRILGADTDWRQDGRRLFIFPLPKNASTIIIEYKTNTFDINQLNERDHDLVKRYALARTKMALSWIRTKYDSFPTAQGTASLDGQAMRDDARQDLEQLEEEIGASGMPMMFFTA